jgi:uncharacterized RDD family membrane protein YckC
MNYAGFFTRFFALLIDQIAMAVLAFIVAFLLGGLVGLTLVSNSGFLSFLTGTVALITWVILLIFQFVYFGYFWSKSGQSVGMKLLNIQVVRRTEGKSISFWRGAFRGSLGYYISGLVFSLGFIWAAIDAENETWHDKIFDTWVVRS